MCQLLDIIFFWPSYFMLPTIKMFTTSNSLWGTWWMHEDKDVLDAMAHNFLVCKHGVKASCFWDRAASSPRHYRAGSGRRRGQP